MGDKITRPAKSAELQRAKFLQQALHRRTPALSLSEDAVIVNSTGTASFLSDSPEVQKAYTEAGASMASSRACSASVLMRPLDAGLTRLLCPPIAPRKPSGWERFWIRAK